MTGYYQCPQCEYTHAHKKELLLHMWAEHLLDINTYICPCCNYFTENQKKLRNHLKTIHCPPRANKKVLESINQFLI